jgi:hypothetical protein
MLFDPRAHTLKRGAARQIMADLFATTSEEQETHPALAPDDSPTKTPAKRQSAGRRPHADGVSHYSRSQVNTLPSIVSSLVESASHGVVSVYT